VTLPYGPEFDDEADQAHGPSRALVAAWMGLAAVLGLAVGYVIVADTPSGDRERTALTTELPPVAEDDAPEPGAGEQATAPSRRLTPEGGVPLEPLRDPAVDAPGEPAPSREETDAAGEDTQASERAAERSVPQAPAIPTGAGGSGRDSASGSRDRAEERAGANAPRTAWRQHAREPSAVPQGFDRVAVVVRGLGLDDNRTKRAIAALPGEMALAFSPYGSQLATHMKRARAAGHELFMELPMQPKGFPVPDPGELGLKVEAPPARNLDRLRTVLDAGTAHLGVVARWGSAIVAERKALQPILQAIGKRGLIYVSNGRSRADQSAAAAGDAGTPHLTADAILDRRPVGPSVVRSWLAAATRIAQESGLALLLVNAYPMTLEALTRWSQTLEARGIALVPVSAALDQSAADQAARLR